MNNEEIKSFTMNVIKKKIINKKGEIYKKFRNLKILFNILNSITGLSILGSFSYNIYSIYNDNMPGVIGVLIGAIPFLFFFINNFIKSLISYNFYKSKIELTHEEIVELSNVIPRNQMEVFLLLNKNKNLENWIIEIEEYETKNNEELSVLNQYTSRKKYLDSIYENKQQKGDSIC